MNLATFFESFFGWVKQFFLFGYNNFVFRFSLGDQLIAVRLYDVLFATLVIFIVVSVFWRSGKW